MQTVARYRSQMTETRSQNDLGPRIQPCLVDGRPEEDPKPKAMSGFRFLGFCLLASRKEVIQPQVPLRLPCYDFTPVADLTVVGSLPGLPQGCCTAFG